MLKKNNILFIFWKKCIFLVIVWNYISYKQLKIYFKLYCESKKTVGNRFIIKQTFFALLDITKVIKNFKNFTKKSLYFKLLLKSKCYFL